MAGPSAMTAADIAAALNANPSLIGPVQSALAQGNGLTASTAAPGSALEGQVDALTASIPVVSADAIGADAAGVQSADDALYQAFLDAAGPVIANGQRNRVVELGAGVYRLTRTLNIRLNGWTLRGQGKGRTVLLIDHGAGPGVQILAPGDVRVEKLSVLPSSYRAGLPQSDSLPGILSRPDTGGTFRHKIIDVECQLHPGDGVWMLSPELAEIKDCTLNNNKGSGLKIEGAALDANGKPIANLANEISQVRCRLNGRYGIHIRNMTAQLLSTPECLSNALGQVYLDNASQCSVIAPDIEAFERIAADPQIAGLIITGKGNVVQGGDFFKVGRGIVCVSAPNTTIITPAIKGDEFYPVAVGISLDGASQNSLVDFSPGEYVTSAVSDASRNSQVRLNGYPLDGTRTRRKVNTSAGGNYVPDFSVASYFRLTLNADIVIGGPSNLDPRGGNTASQRVTFELVQPASGQVFNVSFGPNYRNFFTMQGAATGPNGTPGKVTLVEFEQTYQNNAMQQVAANYWV